MALVRTIGTFCYIACDRRNCTRKIEQNDEEALLQLAKICGWERRGDRWVCSECVKKEPPKTGKKKSSKSQRKAAPPH